MALAEAGFDLEHDLRSDAITVPTDEMWEAMRGAELGWALAGEDETIARLEQLGAELSGKENSLLVPTGAMGNLVALMSHTRRGDQVVLEAASHILWAEEWGFAYVCGVAPRIIDAPGGMPSPDAVDAAITDVRFGFESHTSLVCLENSHNGWGGTAADPASVEAVCAVAHGHGAAVHVDGARIFNSCAALGVELRDLAAPLDSVMFNLNKGLSAPFGALVCGASDFIARCRLNLRRIGAASFHQGGMFAAAGIVALETMRQRLDSDNARARLLAERLQSVRGVSVTPDKVETNIVMARLDTQMIDAAGVVEYLETLGVRAYAYTGDVVRFVTHRHVTDAAVDRVAEALHQRLGAAPSSKTELLPT